MSPEHEETRQVVRLVLPADFLNRVSPEASEEVRRKVCDDLYQPLVAAAMQLRGANEEAAHGAATELLMHLMKGKRFEKSPRHYLVGALRRNLSRELGKQRKSTGDVSIDDPDAGIEAAGSDQTDGSAAENDQLRLLVKLQEFALRSSNNDDQADPHLALDEMIRLRDRSFAIDDVIGEQPDTLARDRAMARLYARHCRARRRLDAALVDAGERGAFSTAGSPEQRLESSRQVAAELRSLLAQLRGAGGRRSAGPPP